jgi:hypothetical protein
MIAPLEKLIDWSSVQVMTLMMPAKKYDRAGGSHSIS